MAIEPVRCQTHSLPRLDATCYQADAAVLWTLTTFDRAKLTLNQAFHALFRELLLHTSVREHLFCPAYILMPDHIHFVWLGTQPDSDQLTGMRFFRTYFARAIKPLRLQPQPHDHVFTPDERRRNAFAKACQYVLLNPLRAELVEKPQLWPFSGCLLPGYPELNPFSDDFWPTFWRIFVKLRNPICDKHIPLRRLYSSESR